MKTQLLLAGATVLLAACGGGGGGSAPTSSSGGSPSQATPATTTAFSCPSGYKSLALTNSVVANANLNLVTDDGIATLTMKTLPSGVRDDFTVCLGKPDPVPAGVTADYVYEVKTSGDLRSLASSTLTLNFTTNVKPTQTPQVIELASVSNGVATYTSVLQGASISVAPDYSLTANAQVDGLYVVRLTK